MTIRKFFNSIPEVQGNIIVKKWSNEDDCYVSTIRLQDENEHPIDCLEESDYDKKIKYIYAVDNSIILEIDKEDD